MRPQECSHFTNISLTHLCNEHSQVETPTAFAQEDLERRLREILHLPEKRQIDTLREDWAQLLQSSPAFKS